MIFLDEFVIVDLYEIVLAPAKDDAIKNISLNSLVKKKKNLFFIFLFI